MTMKQIQKLRRELQESGDEYLVNINRTLTDSQLVRLAELIAAGESQ